MGGEGQTLPTVSKKVAVFWNSLTCIQAPEKSLPGEEQNTPPTFRPSCVYHYASLLFPFPRTGGQEHTLNSPTSPSVDLNSSSCPYLYLPFLPPSTVSQFLEGEQTCCDAEEESSSICLEQTGALPRPPSTYLQTSSSQHGETLPAMVPLLYGIPHHLLPYAQFGPQIHY